jgi:DNA polymerase-3 subunit epsilon
MTEVESSDLVAQLNDAARSAQFWPWCLALTIALMFLSPLLFLVGAPLTLWLFWKDRVRRTVVAFYDVHGEDEAQRFQRLVDSFEQARGVQRAWHVVASGAVSTTYQHKVNAGASSLVSRLPLTRNFGGPTHLSSNIAVPSLATARRSVYLLPDRVLVRDGRYYADVAYQNLQSVATVQHFIEDGAVPSDSLVLGHTWQYVNVKGGPDRRFKNNRQLPILQYGRLALSGEGGYNATFDFSNPRASSILTEALSEMAVAARRDSSEPRREHPAVMRRPSSPVPVTPRLASTTPTYASQLEPVVLAASLPSTSTHERPGQGGHSETPIDLDRLLGDSAAPSVSTSSGAGHARSAPGAPLSRRRLSADGRLAVVGESHYQPALHRAARGAAAGSDFDQHLPVVAVLVPEPENPHDPYAVRVEIVTGAHAETAGYLCRSDARAYQATLLALRDAGYVGSCPGRITGGGPGRLYGVYLHLAGPEALLLENLVGEIDLLEPERHVTVTREESHQETLARHHLTTRSLTRVAAELVSSSMSHGKYKDAYAVEVRLGGERVGELTAGMSTRYKHLVVASEEGGNCVTCEAVITHGERGFQIDLRLPNAN